MTGSRDERVLDALAGRTVWSATPPPAMRGPAERLSERLRWASERGVAVTRLTATDADALPVRRDDVVVMHDVSSVALTAPLRELGAHAVWNVSEGRAVVVAGIDAYLVTWGRRVAAFIPACDRVADLDLDDAAWSGLLAAVVSDDRADRVGGTRRSRPVVAAH
jgi:hypothetical protein